MHNNYLLVVGVVQEEGINAVLFDGVLSDWTFVLLLKGVQWGPRLQVKSSHRSERNAGNFFGFKRLMTACVCRLHHVALCMLRSTFTHVVSA